MLCGAVPCRAVRYCAVLYRAVPCCALCRAACCAVLTLSCMPGLRRRSIIHQYRGTPHHVLTYYMVESQEMHSQLSSAQLWLTNAQRSAAPCGAVPFPAVRCCAVLRCAFFRTHSTKHHAMYQIPGTRYRYVYIRIFAFFIDCPPSRSSSCFFFANDTRTPYQNVTSPSSTHTARGHQLCTSSCWHYQIGCRAK